jgi:hypothetical protein
MKEFLLFCSGFLIGCAVGWQETVRLFMKIKLFFEGMM